MHATSASRLSRDWYILRSHWQALDGNMHIHCTRFLRSTSGGRLPCVCPCFDLTCSSAYVAS
eukprot:10599-Eustigmatos_ZCMA.PRE.1